MIRLEQRAPNIPPLLRSVVVVWLSFGLLLGCSITPQAPNTDHVVATSEQLVGDAAAFLQQAPAGSARAFETGPWHGGGAKITVQAVYYAASGRHCRPIEIDADGQAPQLWTACQTGEGEWGLGRPVTLMSGGM